MVKEKEILTAKEVADYLHLHPLTVHRYAREGKIPGFKIGTDWRFHKKYIENWIKEKVRGIYRLAQFPSQDRPDLVLWALWSASRKGVVQGVYSHETALSIYELTDIMPAKYHITVPKSFRKSSAIPRNIVLHRGNIKPQDVRNMQGYLVTTPAKTICDMLESGTMHTRDIMAALKQAQKSGLVTQEEARRIRACRKTDDK